MTAWYASRFTPDPRKRQTACEDCGRALYFPASKPGFHTCGVPCKPAEPTTLDLKDGSIPE